ncbi:LysR substrate-binding domain-containing protein [Telmatospirillum sp.]|uniref:LysR family transcriptional regulator n=1 Tax=Telmatospirillum sp. TaxID=2079197 RepID=UPI00284C1C41|nr:LysR substrate-binding domain-containing protein [Telmatospirillum sp.]MDR3438883.1 LysR substrate-binding domain-containing protein [Telmatospirillum sp.]
MRDLRQLRYFITVARQMHFSRAAEQLHIAQPSLSQNIRQLEESLGVSLFVRTSRSVKLTAAGQVFYEEAVRTLEQMEHACRAAQMVARGERGRLAIGFTTTTIMGDLRRLIHLYRERYPSVELVLRGMMVDDLVEQLYDGDLDVICTDSKIEDSALQSHPVSSPPWVLAVHKTNPLARRRCISLSDAANQPFLTATQYKTMSLCDDMVSTCKNSGFNIDVRLSADSVPCALSAVDANLGVALVYHMPDCQPANVVCKKIVGNNLNAQMRLSWRQGDMMPAAAQFLALLE